MRHRCAAVVVAVLLALLVVASPARAQGERTVFDQVLDLYQTHDVVLLGEQHDRRLNFEFRMALLRHPRFASTVQDIVIECANSRYQQVLDDFVLRLQDVPAEKLQEIWRNTTMPTGVWDSPIYEEFIRAVRSVNASLRPGRRIRLVAGDPPIDWTAITSPEQVTREPLFLKRDETAYTAIEKESLQKHRKALVIYGSAHLFSRMVQVTHAHAPSNGRGTQHRILLAGEVPGRAYTIIPLSAQSMREYTRTGTVAPERAQTRPSTNSIPAQDSERGLAVPEFEVSEFQAVTGTRTAPILLEVGGSELARLPASKFFGRMAGDAPVGDLMDAILYLGTGADEIVPATADVMNDTVYQNELKRRRDLFAKAGPPPPKK